MTEKIRSELMRMSTAWNRFWFSPTSLSTLVIFRVVYGSVVSLWALALLPDSWSFLTSDGVLPKHPDSRLLRTGLLDWFAFDAAAVLAVAALVPVGVLIAAGVRTRIMTVLNFVLLLSITRRNPEIVNSGDSLLRHFGFFLMFSRAGDALSWDRWQRHRENFWSVPERAPWALRLIQIQVSFVYFLSTFAKVQGEDWIDGTALSEIWRAGDYVRFGVPLFVHDSLLASNLVTYATLGVELVLALFIWNRAARPYVIASGVLLHLGIEFTMAVGFFNAAVITGYLSFLPENRSLVVLERLHRRLVRSRLRPLRAIGRVGVASP